MIIYIIEYFIIKILYFIEILGNIAMFIIFIVEINIIIVIFTMNLIKITILHGKNFENASMPQHFYKI